MAGGGRGGAAPTGSDALMMAVSPRLSKMPSSDLSAGGTMSPLRAPMVTGINATWDDAVPAHLANGRKRAQPVPNAQLPPQADPRTAALWDDDHYRFDNPFDGYNRHRGCPDFPGTSSWSYWVSPVGTGGVALPAGWLDRIRTLRMDDMRWLLDSCCAPVWDLITPNDHALRLAQVLKHQFDMSAAFESDVVDKSEFCVNPSHPECEKLREYAESLEATIREYKAELALTVPKADLAEPMRIAKALGAQQTAVCAEMMQFRDDVAEMWRSAEECIVDRLERLRRHQERLAAAPPLPTAAQSRTSLEHDAFRIRLRVLGKAAAAFVKDTDDAMLSFRLPSQVQQVPKKMDSWWEGVWEEAMEGVNPNWQADKEMPPEGKVDDLMTWDGRDFALTDTLHFRAAAALVRKAHSVAELASVGTGNAEARRLRVEVAGLQEEIHRLRTELDAVPSRRNTVREAPATPPPPPPVPAPAPAPAKPLPKREKSRGEVEDEMMKLGLKLRAYYHGPSCGAAGRERLREIFSEFAGADEAEECAAALGGNFRPKGQAKQFKGLAERLQERTTQAQERILKLRQARGRQFLGQAADDDGSSQTNSPLLVLPKSDIGASFGASLDALGQSSGGFQVNVAGSQGAGSSTEAALAAWPFAAGRPKGRPATTGAGAPRAAGAAATMFGRLVRGPGQLGMPQQHSQPAAGGFASLMGSPRGWTGPPRGPDGAPMPQPPPGVVTTRQAHSAPRGRGLPLDRLMQGMMRAQQLVSSSGTGREAATNLPVQWSGGRGRPLTANLGIRGF
eukprot:TRINITY_DN3793_c0_g1_i1.p1 TRINITY_DN3793_c0_g1~~TRINITY_DN3793_c0_g1_i1.p1  ORF type:complete len:812 (+),score=246.67 TRINITY_DN3793_c0_g1_i1:68-2437(+)